MNISIITVLRQIFLKIQIYLNRPINFMVNHSKVVHHHVSQIQVLYDLRET